MSADNIKSADRVLRILELLSEDAEGFPASRVAKTLDIPISSCVGLLGTMLNHGFITFDQASRNYALTSKICQIGSKLQSPNPLEETVIRYARQLHRELGVVAAVSRRAGLFIEWAYTVGRTYVHPGTTMPLFKSLNGMASLNHLSESKVAELVDSYNDKFGREVAVQRGEILKRWRNTRDKDYISGVPPCFPGLGVICFTLTDTTTGEEVLLTVQMPLNELSYREPALVRTVRQFVSSYSSGQTTASVN